MILWIFIWRGCSITNKLTSPPTGPPKINNDPTQTDPDKKTQISLQREITIETGGAGTVNPPVTNTLVKIPAPTLAKSPAMETSVTKTSVNADDIETRPLPNIGSTNNGGNNNGGSDSGSSGKADTEIDGKKSSYLNQPGKIGEIYSDSDDEFIGDQNQQFSHKRHTRHAIDETIISNLNGEKIIHGGALSAKYTDAFNNFRITVGNTASEITNTFLPIQNVKRPVFIPFFDKYRLWPGRTVIIKGNFNQLDVDFVNLDSNEVLHNVCIKNDNFYIDGSVKMSHLGNIINKLNDDESSATLAIECNLNYIQISCNEYKLGDLFEIDYENIGFLYIDALSLKIIDVEDTVYE